MQCTEMIQVSRKTVNQALGRVLGCILDEYEWYFIDIDERYCNADRICMFWAANAKIEKRNRSQTIKEIDPDPEIDKFEF